jgi:acyl carrier protein
MAAGDVTTDGATAGGATAGDVTAGDVTEALAAATSDESLLRASVTAATLLEGHLCLDSVDLAALGAVLRDRYGPVVDLVGYVAGLDIDEIIGLTVGGVADYVNRCLLSSPHDGTGRGPVPDRVPAVQPARREGP